MKAFTIKHSFSEYFTSHGFTSHGWGNGYVIIPEGHPLHGMGYDDIHDQYDIDVHGGLTFSESAKSLKESKWIPDDVEVSDTDWIIGFDTAHHGDSMARWPSEESVLRECESLISQIENLKVNSN